MNDFSRGDALPRIPKEAAIERLTAAFKQIDRCFIGENNSDVLEKIKGLLGANVSREELLKIIRDLNNEQPEGIFFNLEGMIKSGEII